MVEDEMQDQLQSVSNGTVVGEVLFDSKMLHVIESISPSVSEALEGSVSCFAFMLLLSYAVCREGSMRRS